MAYPCEVVNVVAISMHDEPAGLRMEIWLFHDCECCMCFFVFRHLSVGAMAESIEGLKARKAGLNGAMSEGGGWLDDKIVRRMIMVVVQSW